MVNSDLRPVNDRVKKTVFFHTVKYGAIFGKLCFILIYIYADI